MSVINDKMQELNAKVDSVSHALNHDFCPWANKWFYWMKQPFWCCMLAIGASFICGLLVNTAVLGLSLILSVILILGTVWPMIAMRSIECEVLIDQHRVRVGERINLKVSIMNKWPWPVWGIHLQSADGADQDIALSCLSGWGKSEFIWSIEALQRGVFPQKKPMIATGFPFGIFHASKPVQVSHQVIIWPQTEKLDALPDTADSQDQSERYSPRHVGDAGDLMGTRPFRIGDSLRQVHWGQTARSGQLIVIERQAPATTALTIIPDLCREHHVFTGDRNSLELTISVTASIVEHLHQSHGLVVCKVGDQYLACGRSEVEYRLLMDALAMIPEYGIEQKILQHTQTNKRSLPATRVSIITDKSFNSSVGSISGGRVIVIPTTPEPTEVNTHKNKMSVGKDATLGIKAVWRKVCYAA